MKIHAVDNFPANHVIVVENAVVVDEGPLSQLVWLPGDDEFVELLMAPAEVPGFIAKFYPSAIERRLN